MEDIVIQIYPDKISADLAKNTLETNGIKGVTQTIGGGMSIPNINGRTALRVLKKDEQKAKELLKIGQQQNKDTTERARGLLIKWILLIILIIIMIVLMGVFVTLFKSLKS